MSMDSILRRKCRCSFIAVTCFLFIAGLQQSGEGNNDVIVVADKTAKVFLDISPDTVTSLDLALPVDDFLRCIREMTGATLPRLGHDGKLPSDLTETSLIPIRIELLSPPRGQERFDAQKGQGYTIEVKPDRIVLSAHTPLGIQNAFYSILDHWGCRWVMVGKLGEVIPVRKTLSLPEGTIRSPKCYDTSVEARSGLPTEVSTWRKRNRSASAFWLSGQHYWFYAIPPKEYFDKHPEWYALIAGKRMPTQLCTTNPEVIAKMIEAAKEFLGKKHPNALAFPMDPMDNVDYCRCDRCRALDPPGTNLVNLPLLTDRVLGFANAVARGIAKEFPDRVVALYAYTNHTMPPVNIKPEKNVAIIITRNNYCLLHYTPNDRCPSSIAFYDLVRQWRDLTPNIYLYDYDPISWIGCLPCPIFMDRAAALSTLFKEYGIRGGVTDFILDSTRVYPAFYINAYFERRIKVNPDLTPNEILSDMCEGFFGPAAEPMEKYYRTLSRVTDSVHPGRKAVGCGVYRYEELFNKKMIVEARKQLSRAVTLAKNRYPYQERIRLIDLSQQYLEAYLDGMWNARDKKYKQTLAAFDRVNKLIDELDQAKAIDVNDARKHMNVAKLKALAEHFPDKLGMVRRWKLHGPFNNETRDADLIVDKPETVSSIDGWSDYISPEGLLNMETILKNKPVPWNLSYMYAGVKVWAPQMMKAELRMDSFCPFRVYVNGESVYHRPGLNQDAPDKRIVPVTLNQGENVIVVKLSQTISKPYAFPWGLYFRIIEPSLKIYTDKSTKKL